MQASDVDLTVYREMLQYATRILVTPCINTRSTSNERGSGGPPLRCLVAAGRVLRQDAWGDGEALDLVSQSLNWNAHAASNPHHRQLAGRQQLVELGPANAQ